MTLLLPTARAINPLGEPEETATVLTFTLAVPSATVGVTLMLAVVLGTVAV